MPQGWPDARDGLRLQTEWQMDSGRAESNAKGRIDGWWGNINWTLTVWQMRVLQRERGEFRNVKLTIWKDYEPNADVSRELLEYYDLVDGTHRDADAGWFTKHVRQYDLQQQLWQFHVAAVDSGLALNKAYLKRLPAGERQFAEAWGYTMVDMIALINFPTHDEWLGPFNDAAMPRRIITPADLKVFGDSDLPFDQRASVMAIHKIHKSEKGTGGLLKKTLKLFITSAERAELAAHVLFEALQDDDPVGFIWWAIRNHTPGHNSLPLPSKPATPENDGPPSMPADCGKLTFAGICDGDVVRWCDDGPQALDCAASKLTCGWNAKQGYYDCL
jgi:hypothetical protein